MSNVIYKDRKNTNCRKWDGCLEKFGREDLLPFWIADMDFEVPACVKDSLKDFVEFGVFGYSDASEEYYQAFINWEKTYHDYEVKKEWIQFAPGVVPAFNWVIHILTEKDDAIILMPPVYYPFFDAIENNGRKLVKCPLIRKGQSYVMDYENFEKKIVENDVKLFMMCSPHNPAGRVWTKEELKTVLDICKKHHVYVIADEIHQDLVMSGQKKITAATVGDYDEILVTLTAATKTFNLASAQNAFVIIPNDEIRQKYDDYLQNTLRIHFGNAFGYLAVQSAYEGGREWLDEVLEIVEGNYHLMKNILEENLPEVWISELQGTYLMWIDLGKYIKPEDMEHVIQDECGIAVDYGSWFGGTSGGDEYAGFIRINLATRPENVEIAANNIVKALKK